MAVADEAVVTRVNYISGISQAMNVLIAKRGQVYS
jgi:hypothetical protein